MSYQEACKKVGQEIENRILKTKTTKISAIGVVLIFISALSFLFLPYDISNGNHAKAIELITSYGFILPKIILLLYLLTILCIAIPSVPDRFKFATTFILVNILLVFATWLEIKSRFPSATDAIEHEYIPLAAGAVIVPMVCWILFGVEAGKTAPRFIFFKFTRKIGAWIQKKYDERNKKQRSVHQ